MFTRLPGDRVISDEGFEISILGGGYRDSLELHFIENGRLLVFDIFFECPPYLEKKSALIVEIPLELSWSNFTDDQIREVLSSEDKSRVLENIDRALDFIKVYHRMRFE